MFKSFWHISCNPMTLYILKRKTIKQNQANLQPLLSCSSPGTIDDFAEASAMRSYQDLLDSLNLAFFCQPACLCTDFCPQLFICCASKCTLYWIQRFTREQLLIWAKDLTASGSIEDRTVYSDYEEQSGSHCKPK